MYLHGARRSYTNIIYVHIYYSYGMGTFTCLLTTVCHLLIILIRKTHMY